MPNNQEDFIPVYLFTGFLEAGKTRFIQDALEDERFNTGERTLLLICEEGELEYDFSRFPKDAVIPVIIEEQSELNPEHLTGLLKQHNAERVVIEYNGMWLLTDLFQSMPDDWGVYQVVCIADATTFMTYNANMRSLVVDKLNACEMICFNRFTEDMTVKDYHQIVRGVSRRIDIYYEYPDGKTMFDDIEDPLPFDVNAANIVIEDRDYALWFRDLMETPDKYAGKQVTFKCMAVRQPNFPKNMAAVGRHIMTCCVEDIQFCWLGGFHDGTFTPKKGQWYTVSGKVELKRSRDGSPAPILTISEIHDAEAPAQEVATFY